MKWDAVERLVTAAGPGAALLVLLALLVMVLWNKVGVPLLDRIHAIGEQHANMASDCKDAALISREAARSMELTQAHALAVSKSQERVLARTESLVDKLVKSE